MRGEAKPLEPGKRQQRRVGHDPRSSLRSRVSTLPRKSMT